MKLIGSLGSPFVRKVRIFAIEKNIPFDLECMDVWKSESAISKFNPLGKIPCLHLDSGHNLVDSRTIVEYLDSMSPLINLIPQTPFERALVRTTEAIIDGFLEAAILARREVIFRPPEKQSQEWIERQMNKVDQALKEISKNIGESEWCHYEEFGLADIALGSALDWLKFRLPDYKWEGQYRNLDRLLTKLSSRPSFKLTYPQD